MTHLSHRAKTSRLLRAPADDRRRHYRFDHHGMVARVGAALVDVHDLSVGGARTGRLEAPVGSLVELVLTPREGKRLHLNDAVAIVGEVVEHGGAATRLRFDRLTYSQAKFIVAHLGRRMGIEPYIVR